QFLEQMPSRGYQSTVSPVLHFGLGKKASVDSLQIVWLSGKKQVLTNTKADQVITLYEKNANFLYQNLQPAKQIFKEVESPVNYQNAVSNINDFKRQPLLVNPFSFSGPCMTKGDVNGDGLE